MKEFIFYQATYCTKKICSEHSKVGKGGRGCSTSDCYLKCMSYMHVRKPESVHPLKKYFFHFFVSLLKQICLEIERGLCPF